jgi:hypothetical protein
MRITKQSKDRMVIRGDKRRIKRNVIYGVFIAAAIIVPIVFLIIRGNFSITNVSDVIMDITFPVVVIVGISTVLYRESSRIVIDKSKGRLSVRLPFSDVMSGTYPLKAVSEVRLRHHGNPYHFPKLSIVLNNDEEIILSSDVMLSTPAVYAPPLYDHVKREQQLASDIAGFMGVRFHEIKGGDVPFGLDQVDKDVTWAEDAEKKEEQVSD